MGPLQPVIDSLLISFPALFAIVNPPGGALIYSQVTADRDHAERVRLAWRVALYSAAVMLVALWIGAHVIGFFGVTLSALRIGGGLVVASRAWELLSAPESREDRKQAQAAQATGDDDVAFFPLTIPFTAGPGTIAVAIALGRQSSDRHARSPRPPGRRLARCPRRRPDRRPLLRRRGPRGRAARPRGLPRPHPPDRVPAALHRRADRADGRAGVRDSDFEAIEMRWSSGLPVQGGLRREVCAVKVAGDVG